jgi:hypothetical protein
LGGYPDVILRNMVERGDFPGVKPGDTAFEATFFTDWFHVNPAGSYIVDLC